MIKQLNVVSKMKVKRREIIAWSLYDFANSGYTTVVITTLYSVYFVNVVVISSPTFNSEQPTNGTFLWTLAIGISNAIVLLSAPMLGAIADQFAIKKQLLFVTTVLCILSTAALAVVPTSQLALTISLLIVSNVMFACGENLIAAFLPEITTTKNIGRISGYGWGLGYLGGLVTLATCLIYMNWTTANGKSEMATIPDTLLLVASIFSICCLPTFLWLQERATPTGPNNTRLKLTHIKMLQQIMRDSFTTVARTLTHLHQFQDLFRFLISLTLFQSGVITIIVIAGIYAQDVIGMGQKEIIRMIMLVNISAALGAILFGTLQDKLGSVATLRITLLLWIVAVCITYFSDRGEFTIWFAANLIGIAMGASQSASRALIGLFSPAARNAEFFGFWGLASKASAIIGPLSYGSINYITHGNHHTAMLSTLGFFIGGLIILVGVNEQRGKLAANNPVSTK